MIQKPPISWVSRTVAVVGCSGPSDVDGFIPLHAHVPMKYLSCDISGSGFGACAAMLGAAAAAFFGGVIFFSLPSCGAEAEACAKRGPEIVRTRETRQSFPRVLFIGDPPGARSYRHPALSRGP